MIRQILAGLSAGVVFLVFDAILNANPLAQRLYAVYRPITRPSINPLAGSLIDLAYGVILAWLFVTLRASLPGHTSLLKGFSFGLIVWFLRVVMRVAGEWVVSNVPPLVHAYSLVAGLVQVLVVTIMIALLLPMAKSTGPA